MEFEMNIKIAFRVDEEGVDLVDNFKDAMDSGAIIIINKDIQMINQHGVTCDDQDIIDDLSNAIIYGLREKA